MAEPRRFEVVDEATEIPPQTRPSQPHAQNVAIGMLGLALKALSQRALIALADLFTLFTAFTVFWLWWSIPDPNEKQIVALTLYAVFILAINVVVRRK